MMEKYEFMTTVEDCFEDCTTPEQLEKRSAEMIEVVQRQKELKTQYLSMGW